MNSYEQKYKEALEVAKRKLCFDKAGMVDSFTPNDIYEMFPELKESEDERIRKGIIRNLEYLMDRAEGFVKDELKERIVWLEKQGEQVSAIRWYNASFIPQEMKELLVEWNSSDATWHDVAFYHANTKTFLNYERELKNVTRWCYVEDLFEEQSNVKETGISQHDKKTCVEWSEEDEEILGEIIDFFENGTVKLQHDLSLYASWLKSLKGRVGCEVNCTTTKKWKPSDEQMNVLLSEVTGWVKGCHKQIVLESLYNDLKKLK